MWSERDVYTKKINQLKGWKNSFAELRIRNIRFSKAMLKRKWFETRKGKISFIDAKGEFRTVGVMQTLASF